MITLIRSINVLLYEKSEAISFSVLPKIKSSTYIQKYLPRIHAITKKKKNSSYSFFQSIN